MSDVDYTQWCYKVLFVYSDHLEEELTLWGTHGWELASIVPETITVSNPNPYLNPPPRYIVILKQKEQYNE
jgi:hypothetical protein